MVNSSSGPTYVLVAVTNGNKVTAPAIIFKTAQVQMQNFS